MKEVTKKEEKEIVKKENNKIKDLLKKMIKTKVGLITLISLVVVIALATVLMITSAKKENVDSDLLIATIKKSSELTTSKITFKGIVQFKDKGIVILNKSDFLMQYTAEASVGIDLDKVEITANNITKKINITIPKAKVLSIKVDPKKIKYYDEKFSLFNFNQKEDANKAQELAEKEAKKEIEKLGVIESANDQASALILGLIHNLIPNDYSTEVKIK